MKKVGIGVGAVVGILVLGVLGMAMSQPDKTHLERSITVAAAPEDMKAFAHDLEGVNAWSPWDERDPNLVRKYSDPKSGEGAWYHWSGNDDVGEGKMTIRKATDSQVIIDLQFIKPFEGKAVSTISWKAEGDGTKVTWGFDQDNAFASKMFMVFMDFEEMIGGDYEAGLAMLKPQVEEAAKKRIAAAKKAADEKAAAEKKAAADKAAADKAAADNAAAADGTGAPAAGSAGGTPAAGGDAAKGKAADAPRP